MGFFNINGKFYAAMTRISDVILLNLLFVLTSIPIITIGASLTALNYVSFKIAEGKDYHLLKSYLKSFKENFKQSTIIWIIFIILGFIYMFYVQYFQVLTSGSFLVKGIFLLIGIVYSTYFIYSFALLSKFEYKILSLFRNLPLVAISYFLCTVVVLLISIGPWFLFTFILSKYFSFYSVIMLIVGIAGTVVLCDSFISKVFDDLIRTVGVKQE